MVIHSHFLNWYQRMSIKWIAHLYIGTKALITGTNDTFPKTNHSYQVELMAVHNRHYIQSFFHDYIF